MRIEERRTWSAAGRGQGPATTAANLFSRCARVIGSASSARRERMSDVALAALAIVGLAGLAVALAAWLGRRGVAALLLVVWVLLAGALVLQAVVGGRVVGLLALVLTVLALIGRWALAEAGWVRRRGRDER